MWSIKPLKWEEARPGWWMASSIFGTLNVEQRDDGTCFWSYCVDEYYDEGQEECASIEEGKEKVWKFYLERLLLALQEV